MHFDVIHGLNLLVLTLAQGPQLFENWIKRTAHGAMELLLGNSIWTLRIIWKAGVLPEHLGSAH